MTFRMTAPKHQPATQYSPACTVRRIINLPIAIVHSRVWGWEAYVSYTDPLVLDEALWSIHRYGETMREALAAVEAFMNKKLPEGRTKL